MNRQMRRALKKQVGGDAQEKMSHQVAQFGKLPDKCSACAAPFDKKERSMVESWKVVVRQEVVRLFCPECVDKAKEVLENGDT